MLTHARAGHHGAPTHAQDVPYDGATTGMAADTELISPLTVQQFVPNIAGAQTAPRTSVDPTLEQGEGRAPGWQWGWMRKNIPFAPRTAGSHKQPHFPLALRPEARMGSGHAPGSGPGQLPGQSARGSRPAMSLAQPTTVYATAQHAPLAPWTEPI